MASRSALEAAKEARPTPATSSKIPVRRWCLFFSRYWAADSLSLLLYEEGSGSTCGWRESTHNKWTATKKAAFFTARVLRFHQLSSREEKLLHSLGTAVVNTKLENIKTKAYRIYNPLLYSHYSTTYWKRYSSGLQQISFKSLLTRLEQKGQIAFCIN